MFAKIMTLMWNFSSKFHVIVIIFANSCNAPNRTTALLMTKLSTFPFSSNVTFIQVPAEMRANHHASLGYNVGLTQRGIQFVYILISITKGTNCIQVGGKPATWCLITIFKSPSLGFSMYLITNTTAEHWHSNQNLAMHLFDTAMHLSDMIDL